MSDAATAAVTRHLRAIIRGADPEVVAVEILTILRGHGWRPTVAAAPPPQPSRPLPPERVHAIAARARQAINREEP